MTTTLESPQIKPRNLRKPKLLHAPLRTVGPTEHAQRLALRGWVECPECQKTFVRGAVIEQPQEPLREPLAGYTGPCMQTSVYCDHCDKIFLQLWATDGTGRVLARIGEYGVVTNRKHVDRFLTQHPEARGVLQS